MFVASRTERKLVKELLELIYEDPDNWDKPSYTYRHSSGVEIWQDRGDLYKPDTYSFTWWNRRKVKRALAYLKIKIATRTLANIYRINNETNNV